ncbi:MAG: outer membrane lipoprotein carrier protein LolA [Sphingomonas bacterium]|nr:outer membrane lipoprotein carrier protein LolA [Sphingomonas bacterium]
MMMFPTQLARALAPIAAVALLAAPAVAATNPELARVESHLAASQSMTANFVQTDSRNRALRGTVQIKRPGKIRFEYGRGANMLLVGNGKTLTFVDYEVGQKSSWPVAKSPLSVLLASNPDLQRIARVVPSKDPRVLLVRARDARRPEFGTILLGFVRNPAAPGGLLLEGWTAIDAQNKRTTVKLDGQRYNVAVAENAFTYAEPTKRGR